MVSRGGIFLCPLNSEGVEIIEKRLSISAGKLFERDSFGPRVADSLVVNISDVHHLCHLVSGILKIATEQILKHVGAEITDMCVKINCRATGIQANEIFFNRYELFFFSGKTVLEDKWHKD